MSRRAAAITIAVVCLAALAALAWWRFAGRAARDSSAPESPVSAAPNAAPPAAPPAPGAAELPAWSVRLYFPGADGLLYPETRELHAADDPQQRLHTLLAAVLAGPADAALQPPLPHGVEIDAAFLGADGVAYLALRSTDHPAPPSAGSQYEMTSIYSLVDSIALNLDGAKRVVLLWNGSQLESFGGHLDTSRPLAPDTSLLAKAPGEATPPPATGETPPSTPQ